MIQVLNQKLTNLDNDIQHNELRRQPLPDMLGETLHTGMIEERSTD